MTQVPIHNIGTVGIVTDLPATELPPEVWSAGQNVRFHDGKVKKFLGHSAVFGAPTVTPYWLLSCQSLTQAWWIYAGLTKVYATDMSSHFNITRQTAAVDVDYAATAELKWNGGVLNGVPVLNNGIDTPQQWSPIAGGTKLVELANWSTWPSATLCKVLRPAFRNFLVALDITEGSTRYPDTLAWGHPADPGSVPSSWNYTSPTVDAGRVPLADTGGFLLDLQMLGNVGIVYKEDAIYTMQYVGGQFIFAIDLISSHTGLLATNCVLPYPGGHFMVTPDDIIVHAGSPGSMRSILSGRQRKYLFDAIDSTYKGRSYVVQNFPKSEMWFCFPETGATQPTRALVWNWETGAIGDRQLGAETAFIARGVVEPSAVSQIWNDDSQPWDADTSTWDQRLFDPANTRLLMARSEATAALYMAENTEQFAGSNMTSYIERTGLSIVGRDREGRPKADANTVKHVTRLLPKIKGGPVDISVGSHEFKDGVVSWSTPVSFDPATDSEVNDIDVVGRYIGVRFSSSNMWELESYDLDISIVGRYP